MEKPSNLIIEKTLNNTATPEESRVVVRWFATREGMEFLNMRMDADLLKIESSSPENMIDHPIPSLEMYESIMRLIRKHRQKKIWLRVAAIVIPLLLLVGQFWYINQHVDLLSDTQIEEVTVPNGEKLQVKFQDGSQVTLNSGTTMKYPEKFGFSERKIELNGEAFFDITPNPHRPFIVNIRGIKIKVLGTTFSVKAYSTENDVTIALETGKIFIYTDTQDVGHLTPGEKAVLDQKNHKWRITKSDVAKSFLWKEDIISFENTPLLDVLHTLTRQYNVEFQLADSAALRYSYTLTSSKKNITNILSELEKITPVKFTKRDQLFVVHIHK